MGGALFGGLGTLAGYSGAKQARKDFKKLQREVRGERDISVKELEGARAGFQEDPILQQLIGLYGRELDASYSPEERRALYDFLGGQVAGLFDKPMGLSDPRVQDQIIASSVEKSLLPAYESAMDQSRDLMAARGLGRSGLASAQARETGYRAAQDKANITRDVRTQGALQELADNLMKQQAAAGFIDMVQNQAAGTQARAGAQQMDYQSALANIAAQIANSRMGYMGMLAGMGTAPNPMSSVGSGLMQTGQLFNQGTSAGAQLMNAFTGRQAQNFREQQWNQTHPYVRQRYGYGY